jgi:hypothetical protein
MRVTVIVPDNVVQVDNIAVHVDLSAYSKIHAVQWADDAGHVEYKDGRANRPLAAEDYDAEVAPYVVLWADAKAALDAAAAEAEAAWNAPFAVRQRLLAAIGERKNALRDGGFTVGGVLWDSDYNARVAYAELAQHLAKDPGYFTRWKASEGNWVDMTAALFDTVYAAGVAHIAAAFAWQESAEARLAVTADADLESFVVEA